MGKQKSPNGGKELGIFDDFYEEVAKRPDVKEVLRKLLGPHKLFMLMEGTKMTLHFGGLRIFDISAMLNEAGIPDSDPRAEVYRSIKGGIAPKDAINELRSIVAREDHVCRSAGAIPINTGEQKRAWWVPIGKTSAFKDAIDQLFTEFHKVRDEQILKPYSQIRAEKEQTWMEAAEASFQNLKALGKQTGDKQDYLRSAKAIFDNRFPSHKDIVTKVAAYSESLQDELPQEIEIMFRDLREKESERMRLENEALENQTRIEKVELQVREAEALKLEDERQARSRMLREAVAKDYSQAKEVMLKLEVEISKITLEIMQAVKEKQPISGSLRRSWRETIEQLNSLSPDNPSWQKALEQLKSVSEKTGKKDEQPSEEELVSVQMQVDRSLEYMRQRTGMAVVSDSLYALIKAGRAESALQNIRTIKDKLTRGLEEVNVLEELLHHREED